MAEEIVFKTRVDTGNTAQDIKKNISDPLAKAGKNVQGTFDKLRGEIKETQEALDKAGKSTKANAKEVDALTKKLDGLTSEYTELSAVASDVNATFEEMHGELQPLTTQISEAEDRMHKLTLEGKSQTQEFKDLQKKVVDYKKAIIETDRAVDSLVEQGRGLGTALQLGSTVISGYGALEGAMVLAGGAGEELQQTFVKLQAIQTVLMSLEELKLSLDKQSLLVTKARAIGIGVLTVAQKAYTWATAGTTAAMKVLRLAMLAIPLVALVAGVIALVSALSSLFSETEKAKEMQDELADSMDRTAKASERANKAFLKNTDDRIRLAQAEGANAQELHELELKRLKAVETVRQKDLKQQAKNIKDITAVGLQAAKEGNDEVLESAKKQLIAANDKYQDLKALDEQYYTERNILQAKFDSEARKQEEEDRKERADKWKAWREEQDRLAEEEAQKALRRQRLISDFLVASIDDETTRRQLALQERHKREREDLIAEFGEDTQLLKSLTMKQSEETMELNNQLAEAEKANRERLNQEQRQKEKEAQDLANADRKAQAEGELIKMREEFEATQELKAELAQIEMDIALQNESLTAGEKFKIQEEYNKKIQDLATETADHEKKMRQEAIDTGINIAEQGASAVQSISDLTFAIQSNNLKEGTAEHERAQKKQFETNKKIQIAGAVISGIQGVINALTAQSVIPEPFGTILKGINAVAIGATTAANVIKIKNTKYQGSGGGGGASTGSTGGGIGAPSVPDIGGTGESTLTEDLLDDAGGDSGAPLPVGGTGQVKIVDSQIKVGLDNQAEVEDTATITD